MRLNILLRTIRGSAMLLIAAFSRSGTQAASDVPVVSVVLNCVMWGILAVVLFRYVRSSGESGHTQRERPRYFYTASEDKSPVVNRNDREQFLFITWLRGIACLFVLVSHYIGMFLLSGVDTVFTQVLPKTQGPPQALTAFVLAFEDFKINFGALGVAIFFLITGFVTTASLCRNNSALFLVKRLVRIWPVYIVGTVFLYCTSQLYLSWAGTTMQGGVRAFLLQASLVRDWFWVPSVDGVGWTLEVQVKMYIVLFLLSRLKVLERKNALIVISFLGAAFIIASNPFMSEILQFNMALYVVIYTIRFSIQFIIFSFIGASFYLMEQKKHTLSEGIVTIVGCTLAFCFSVNTIMPTLLVSYVAAVLLFTMAYMIRESIRVGFFIKFISKISYSFYIVHALNGYYLLSLLDSLGLSPYWSFSIATGASIIAAYILYLAVERPCSLAASKIKGKSW